MSIYFGNNKIGKIYVGGTSIGKVYKGSELVWQKDTNPKLYVANYSEWTSGKYTYYSVEGLLGSWSTAGYVMSCNYKEKYNPSGNVYQDSKIYLISGTLGSSGSKVGSGGSGHANLKDSIIVNGKRFYIYQGDGGVGSPIIYIQEGSVVNNYTMNAFDGLYNPDLTYPVHPTSVTSTSYTYTSYWGTSTVNRTTNDVLTFTKENGLA